MPMLGVPQKGLDQDDGQALFLVYFRYMIELTLRSVGLFQLLPSEP